VDHRAARTVEASRPYRLGGTVLGSACVLSFPGATVGESRFGHGASTKYPARPADLGRREPSSEEEEDYAAQDECVVSGLVGLHNLG
jgi:hypothetical protein